MKDQSGQCDLELMGAYLSRCSPWAGGGAGLLLKALLELAGADTCDYPCLSQVQLELQQTDHCGPSVLGSLATSLGK